MTKATRRAFAGEGGEVDPASPIAVVGDKSKSQLSRILGKNLTISFNQIGRDIPTFADAAGVADLIIKSGVEYDSVVLVHNKFVSAISYEPTTVEIETAEALKESGESALTLLGLHTSESRRRRFPEVRDGGRRHEGSCRVLARERHLRRSCRGPCLRN